MTKCGEKDITVTISQLNLGDVHLLADDRVLAIVERKTISDLEASIRDGRYREQVSRLKQTCEEMHLDRKSVIFLIEGSYLSHQPSRFGRGIESSALVSAMVSLWYREGFTVVNTECVDSSAFYLMKTLLKIRKLTGKSDCTSEAPISSSCSYPTPQKFKVPETILIPCLCQVPGVSQKTAGAVHSKYPSMLALVTAIKNDRTCLDSIRMQCGEKERKLSKTAKDNIYDYLGFTSTKALESRPL